MLAIRMQRSGRKGHTQFRVVVQDSRYSPSSGRVVAYLGSYDPHSKAATLDKDETLKYISNGAQPSERVVSLLKKEGLKLPSWVSEQPEKSKSIRNQDKLRRNRPAEEKAPEAPAVEEPAAETVEAAPETPTEETPVEAKEVTESAEEESSPDETPEPATEADATKS